MKRIREERRENEQGEKQPYLSNKYLHNLFKGGEITHIPNGFWKFISKDRAHESDRVLSIISSYNFEEQSITSSSKMLMNILYVYQIVLKNSRKQIMISPIHEYSSLILPYLGQVEYL